MINFKIVYNILRIAPSELLSLRFFYETIFGMAYYKENRVENVRHCFCFPNQLPQTAVSFEESDFLFKKNTQNIGYWKIGITMRDVDAALEVLLLKANLKVANAIQFENIGYVTHLKDPAGYVIELLQHTFQKNFQPSLQTKKTFLGQPISCPATLGQITIKSKDSKKSCDFYSNILGMKLISIQPSINYPFTLYFFAYTNTEPPNRDLYAIENREWLWQQPFTQIEIQHFHGTELDSGFFYSTNDTQDGRIGHLGVRVCVSKSKFNMIQETYDYEEVIEDKEIVIYDPDGYRIEVINELE